MYSFLSDKESSKYLGLRPGAQRTFGYQNAQHGYLFYALSKTLIILNKVF